LNSGKKEGEEKGRIRLLAGGQEGKRMGVACFLLLLRPNRRKDPQKKAEKRGLSTLLPRSKTGKKRRGGRGEEGKNYNLITSPSTGGGKRVLLLLETPAGI